MITLTVTGVGFFFSFFLANAGLPVYIYEDFDSYRCVCVFFSKYRSTQYMTLTVAGF